MTSFKALPPEKMFVESQIPLDVTIIPENDGRRCAPEFAIPLLPIRKRRQSKPKPDPITEMVEQPTTSAYTAADPIIVPVIEKPEAVVVPPPPKIQKVDVELVTDPYKVSADELHVVDVSEHINTIRGECK